MITKYNADGSRMDRKTCEGSGKMSTYFGPCSDRCEYCGLITRVKADGRYAEHEHTVKVWPRHGCALPL